MSFKLYEVLANSGNYGGERNAGDIKYLVIHYTGNDGDAAFANAQYFRSNVVKASAHYFVDDTTVYRSVPERSTAWAVGGTPWKDCGATGGGKMYGFIKNSNSLSIELCGTAKDGSCRATESTLANAAELARTLMRRYNIHPENVYRHFDVTGKHCPAYMMDEEAWMAFKARLVAPALLDNTPSPAHKEGVEWAVKNGILTGDAAGDLKLTEPVTRQQLCTMLYRDANRKGNA